MFKIVIPPFEGAPAFELEFEHSLVSLSKWEQNYRKPFFTTEEKTREESSYYTEMMLLTPNPPDNWLQLLSREDLVGLNNYMNDSHTATTFREDPRAAKSREIITFELIYSWLIVYEIPFDPCERWHLNNLLTLVRIRGIQTTKQKPMSKNEMREEYNKLNAERRAKLGTTG